MGRGATTSSSILYGSPRRQINWPARIERLERILADEGVAEAFEFACSWRYLPPGGHGRQIVFLIGNAEAERRWPSSMRGGNENEYAYLKGRVLDVTQEMLLDPEGTYEKLAGSEERRWLWERPSDPGILGNRLVETPTSRSGKAGLAEMLGGLAPEDRRLINRVPELWDRPLLRGASEVRMAVELKIAEQAARDLLYRFDVLEHLSPDFFVAKKGHTVHYEDQRCPGRTPCGLDLARLTAARRGAWVDAIKPGQMRNYRSTDRCKICQKRGEAPEDHGHDDVPVFTITEQSEVREAIQKAIGQLPEEGEAEDVVKELRERIGAETREFALKAAMLRFRALPLEAQGKAISALLYALPPEYRDAVVIEKIPDISKRRIMAMVHDVRSLRLPTSAIVKEVVDCGAVSPDLCRQVLEIAAESDRQRAARGF